MYVRDLCLNPDAAEPNGILFAVLRMKKQDVTEAVTALFLIIFCVVCLFKPNTD